MIPLPNLIQNMVDKLGKLQSPWNFYLQQFTQAPPNISDIIVGTSLFNYQAKEPGFVHISGGTVASVTLFRGQIGVSITGTNIIPVAINDIIQVNYSVLPTMKFLANYGQNTGAQ